MVENKETFLPVPDLPEDDIYGHKGPEGGGWIEYKTVIVINNGPRTINISHSDGRMWFIRPQSLISVPTSVAAEVSAMPNIDIISEPRRERYVPPRPEIFDACGNVRVIEV
jgi:hypothetical protein